MNLFSLWFVVARFALRGLFNAEIAFLLVACDLWFVVCGLLGFWFLVFAVLFAL